MSLRALYFYCMCRFRKRFLLAIGFRGRMNRSFQDSKIEGITCGSDFYHFQVHDGLGIDRDDCVVNLTYNSQ